MGVARKVYIAGVGCLLLLRIPGDLLEPKVAASEGGGLGMRLGSSTLPEHEPTADHRKFAILQQEFKSGPEVTAACLTCHTNAASQVMQTSHWTWICPRAKEELASRQHRVVGKGEHVINNFCIALGSNEPRCTSCHAGYGWKDKTFDFSNETLVDCLVCHDTTKTYKKFPTKAGHPVYEPTEWPKGSGKIWQPPDLAYVAQNVGLPSRHTCGTCHFFGGGGEGVKHGDMDETLDMPTREVDVHMNAHGANFSCTQCHTTVNHRISGRCYTIPLSEEPEFVIRGIEKNLLACESCHTSKPHQKAMLNQHTRRVSCQACHVPFIAPKKPTKMWWDWSKAGQKNEQGKPLVKKTQIYPEGGGPNSVTGGTGVTTLTYHGMKGEFIWALKAAPEYVWFNGNVSYTFIGDKIDDRTPGSESGARKGRYDKTDLSKPVVPINRLYGSHDDPNARIYPVKVHRGKQPYDVENKTLAVPKLFPSGPNAQDAYWKSFDWDRAIRAGMAYVGQPYSGKYDFIQTEMYWPLAHMVAPKEEALSCASCHTHDGRLADLTGFYMPGRDRSGGLDLLGWFMVSGALVGTLVHGSFRLFSLGRRTRDDGPKREES